MNGSLLELRGVTKEFETAAGKLRILKGIDLALAPGETVAIQGPSGSGKSTLLGIMAGLERPTSGSLHYEGASLADWSEDRLSEWRRRSVGFVFQNFRLVSSLTALENVLLPLEIQGVDAGSARGRVESVLEEIGLLERADHFPHQLSGGEQQRIAIARAYVHSPKILFADEPTGSIDRDTSGTVIECLLSSRARAETTLVLVTHDPSLAARMGRTLNLEGGSFV